MVSGDEVCRSNPQFLFEVWTMDNLLVCRSEIFLNFYMKRGIRKTVSELVIDRGRPAKKQLYRLYRPFWQLNTSLRLLRLPERRPIFQRRVGKLRVTTQFICIAGDGISWWKEILRSPFRLSNLKSLESILIRGVRMITDKGFQLNTVPHRHTDAALQFL